MTEVRSLLNNGYVLFILGYAALLILVGALVGRRVTRGSSWRSAGWGLPSSSRR